MKKFFLSLIICFGVAFSCDSDHLSPSNTEQVTSTFLNSNSIASANSYSTTSGSGLPVVFGPIALYSVGASASSFIKNLL